jgi:DNA-binding NarL/FixJ family response regulator
MAKPRVMLADDHTMMADGLVRLLTDHYDVVRVVSDGLTLLKEAPGLRPHVVILDLGLPLLNGMEAGKQLKKLLPLTKIIVLTMNEDVGLAKEALGRWASGYLLKKAAASLLVRAIDEVLHHRTYVGPRMARLLEEEHARNPHPDRRAQLTKRQTEVIQLLVEGYTMKEVAALLNLKPRTIAFHKYKIMDEYDLKTHSEFLLFAIKHHIVASCPTTVRAPCGKAPI